MFKTMVRLILSGLLSAFLTVNVSAAADAPRTVSWEDLVPEQGLNPEQPINLDEQGEASGADEPAWLPRASGTQDATVPDLDGKRVKIPAYVVPIDGNPTALTELLLVPYFGACMHVPPPPPGRRQ